MNTYRTITIILCILLVAGCMPTAESPAATLEVGPTDTVAPTATAVPSPTFTPKPTDTVIPSKTPTEFPSPTNTMIPTATEVQTEGIIQFGSPDNSEQFSIPPLSEAEIPNEGDLNTMISNLQDMVSNSSCPNIWVEPIWGPADLVPTRYLIYAPLMEEDGIAVFIRPTSSGSEPYGIVQLSLVEPGVNSNVLIDTYYEPIAENPMPDELEIMVILPGCEPYSILTTDVEAQVVSTPKPLIANVTPPSAAVQKTAQDLGIEHLQPGEKVVLESTSFSIYLRNEPDGDVIGSVTQGETVTIETFTIYDDIFWYLVDTGTEKGWISELHFVPADNVTYWVTPEAQALPMMPWLVTSDDMNSLENVLDIYDWQLSGKLAYDNRVCHQFLGSSWSVSLNLGYNCIFPMDAGTSFGKAIETLYDWGILYPTAVPLELNNDYAQEAAIFGDRYDNGHAVYDLFVRGEDELYWASVSLGVPAGDTVTNLYETYGDSIETFLYDMIIINIERSKTNSTQDS